MTNRIKVGLILRGGEVVDGWVRADTARTITASTTSAGNTFIKSPTDTRSGNRRSDSDFLQPRTRHTNKLASVFHGVPDSCR
ncbi:MAG: hypothetical protein ACYDDU_09175 [Dermatophilaceae bacterium]